MYPGVYASHTRVVYNLVYMLSYTLVGIHLLVYTSLLYLPGYTSWYTLLLPYMLSAVGTGVQLRVEEALGST